MLAELCGRVEQELAFIFNLAEKHMTGSYSWTELSLNPASEGKGAAGQERSGQAKGGSRTGTTGKPNPEQHSRDSEVRTHTPQPSPTGNRGHCPQFCPHSSRCNLGYISMRKEPSPYSTNTGCPGKTITPKFELRIMEEAIGNNG